MFNLNFLLNFFILFILVCIGLGGISCQQKTPSPPQEIYKLWFTAIRENNFDQLSQMHLKNNISWNFRNDHDHTTLMSACHFGHFDLVKKLLDLKVDVNSLDQKNFNAVAYAVYGLGDNESKVKIINLLLENQADPFTETEFKSRAIFAMIESKLIEPLYKVNWGVQCDAYPEKTFSIVNFAQKHRQYYLAAYLQHQRCP